jgi:hypothetical protein
MNTKSPMAVHPDVVRTRTRATTPDFQTSGDWLLPTFQSHWLAELGAFHNVGALRHVGAGAGINGSAGLYGLFEDTASTSSLLALSRTTSPQTLSTARSIAENLKRAAVSIIDWVEDREYEELFRQQVEPVPTGWIKQLSRFKAGPEIAVTWDDEDE